MSRLLAPPEWEGERITLSEVKWKPIAPGVERFSLPDGEPVRRVVTGRRNRMVGAHYSWKVRRHIVVESLPEDRAARLMDCHPDVIDVHAQPETLRIKADGKSIRYTPDLMATFLGGTCVRFEIKRLQDIHPPRPESQADERGWLRWEKAKKVRQRLRAVREGYRRAGLRWVLLPDIAVLAAGDPEVVDEVIANGGRHLGPEDRRRVRDYLVASGGVASLGRCADLVRESEHPLGAILARVIDAGLALDLNRPIEADAPVRLAGFLGSKGD